MSTETTDTPVVDTPTEEAVLPIAQHVREFGPEGKAAADAMDAPVETEVQAEQRRDAEGKFQPGRVRHRAKSQQASAADVPRIQALTAKEKAATERAAALERELTELKAQRPAPERPQVQTVGHAQQMPVRQTQDDPEPADTDPQYESNYPKFLEDRARWAARDENKRFWAQRQHEHLQHQRDMTLGQKLQAAAQKYPDFKQVAIDTPHPWQPGSLVDRYIREDDAGAEILYHLQSHPDERDTLGQMTELQAHRFLSLLSQRLVSSATEAAGTNGAAPRPSVVVLPPKPSTPLRTEAQRVSTPTPTDGTLSIMKHRKAFAHG